jgi:hypothetical protein
MYEFVCLATQRRGGTIVVPDSPKASLISASDTKFRDSYVGAALRPRSIAAAVRRQGLSARDTSLELFAAFQAAASLRGLGAAPTGLAEATESL